MKIDLSDEALEYGHTVRRALEAVGGDRLVQDAEITPAARHDLVAPALAELGAWDLDPRGDADELEAAAALCRAAGWWATPYPVAERVARPRDVDAAGLVVVGDRTPRGALEGLDGQVEGRWLAVTLDGARRWATPKVPTAPARATGFVVDLDLEPVDGSTGAGTGDLALGLVLPCWTLLGMLDRAIDLTRTHVLERDQFGQPLSQFQGVQFQLTDAEVERSGVEALATYALWSIQAGQAGAVADALALRLAAVEAAEVVFRVSHQLHGATGFCDETTVSWFSRYSQPLRRLPFGPATTREQLARHTGRHGLDGLFGGAPAGVEA
jgi:hypothetical protein